MKVRASRVWLIGFLCLLLAAATAGYLVVRPSRTAAVADTILVNGKVITADNDDPARVTIAEAIAIHDGKILAVGSNTQIAKLAAPGTKRLDLRGRTVIPGLIDTHSHLYEWSLDFPWAEQWIPGVQKISVNATTVDEAMVRAQAAVQARAAAVGRGRWVIVDVRPPAIAHAAFGETVTRAKLDEWAPENPTIVRTRASAVLNTLAIGAFERFYGQEIPQEYWIADKARGWSSNYVDFPRCARIDQILANDLPGYARVLKSVMQVNAQTGVTTHATHVQCINGYRVGRLLDQTGEMPIRWAWSEGWAHIFNPRPEDFYQRTVDISGSGSPYFWSVGVNPVNLDGGGIAMCTTIKAPSKIKAREACPDQEAESLRLRALQTMWKNRLRVAGHHLAGDKALDAYFDALERSGLTLEEIRALRPVADHCHLVRPDQIERAKRLSVSFSCAAAIAESAVVEKDYGRQFLTWVGPVKSMLEAGIRPVMSQFGSEQQVRPSPFEDAYAFLTRHSLRGDRPFGVAEQAIKDRMTLLLMMSRWAAPNILREKELGSLELGKWADVVVLEADPLASSEQQFATIRPLMTMVGGKVVFEDPAFRGNTLRFNPLTAEWEKRLVTE